MVPQQLLQLEAQGRWQTQAWISFHNQRETFHKKRRESRSSSTTKGVENKETLKSSTLVSQFSDSVKHQINNLLSNGIVASSIVIGSIFLSIDQLFRVVKLTVSSNSGFINDCWFQINKHSTGHMFATSSFREEGLEGVIPKGLVRWHATIRLDSMFQTVQLPTGVAHLDSSLTNVN